MISKNKEKEIAVGLRKKGLSYNEILGLVPVSKSTLSVWLRSIGIAKRQSQRLTEKRRQAQIKAQQACRDKRIRIEKEIKSLARKKMGKISSRELWLIGTALYWAEGTKQKNHNVSGRVIFSNSDPEMIKIFLEWVRKFCDVSSDNIVFSIYLHETARERKQKVQKYWAAATGFSATRFSQVVWKKNKISTRRKNINKDYYGLLRVVIRRSTNLNRKIAGWIEGICGN